MKFISFLIGLFFLLSFTEEIFAVSDPLSVPNNKLGIHILFPGELHQASDIVNNQGKGSWGYVTIPIQATDRNRGKWQLFLDKCLEEKVIPIIRVATVPDGSSWEEPDNFDLIDFANFLDDLHWPIRNRYVVIFNEVNRPDEFGGKVNPEKYADILQNAIDIFKSRSEDFFILPAGLDNAAINQYGSMYWKQFLSRMNQRQPGIFDRIDGWTSHAYPNPDFSSRPDLSGQNKIDSFRIDLQYLKRFTGKKLPVFITETGWSTKYLSEKQIAFYYDYAFSKVWSDEQVVAVTPFLLNAQDGPFTVFSFLGEKESPKEFVSGFGHFALTGEPDKKENILETPLALITPTGTISSEILGTSTDYPLLVEKLYNNLKIVFGLLNQ